MFVAFRADASPLIGSGHLTRCRSLASKLREDGHETLFLVRNPSKDLHKQLLSEGNEVIVLSWSFSGASEAEDMLAVRNALSGRRPDWLVVDHYGLGKEWEEGIRRSALQTMVIDDIGRPHDCDLLLDQGWLGEGAEPYPDTNSKKLLGPRFALLNPLYASLRTKAQRRSAQIKKILVFFGGADGTGQTLRVLEAIDDPRLSSLHFEVIVGAQNTRREEIYLYSDRLRNVQLVEPLGSLAGLMFAADLFLGAGGSTTWERCCLGLPSIVCWTAENQRAQTLALAARQVQHQLGSADEQTPESWRKALLQTIAEPSQLLYCAGRGMALVDGRGTERVVGWMTLAVDNPDFFTSGALL